MNYHLHQKLKQGNLYRDILIEGLSTITSIVEEFSVVRSD